MIKNIVFDMGEVLLTYKDPSFLCKYGVSEEEANIVVKEILFGDRKNIWRKMDLGLTTEKECCKEYCYYYPEYANGLKAFFTHMDDWLDDNSRTWRLVPELKKNGYKLYILSNWHKENYEYCVCDMPFIPYMDGIVISGYEGLRKPDSEIYKRLCNRYRLNPKESIFFDDKEENVLAAEKFGMTGFVVNSQEELRAAISWFFLHETPRIRYAKAAV